MAPPLSRWVQSLRGLAAPVSHESDAALLERFVRDRNQDAFAELVARHGPMVLHLCHRVLGDPHAAEDAFQATFLVLARKAGKVSRPDKLSGWLYGVASRISLKARKAAARNSCSAGAQPAREPADPRPDPLATVSARDLLRALEDEIQHLPESYRLPVVLCCLEGFTQEEAAVRLGCTPGSVKGRLERGRVKLHARLLRRGLTLAAAFAIVEVNRGVRGAEVVAHCRAAAAGLAGTGEESADTSLSHTVYSLANKELRSMKMGKMTLAFGLVLAAVLAGTGIGRRNVGSEASAAPEEPSARKAAIKWEYKVVARRSMDPDETAQFDPKRADNAVAAALSKLGEEGWELVAVEPPTPRMAGMQMVLDHGSPRYILKRQK
jgi:RNA polymerase sigma factor (sigma-70 family)